jgi:hypothetical protein
MTTDGSRHDLAAVLADWRGDAAVLKKHKQHALATQLEKCADDVEASAADWLTWLSETDAMLRSGKSRDWLRAKFSGWERDGHARLQGRERQYRRVIVPVKHTLSSARAAGIAAAKAARKSA